MNPVVSVILPVYNGEAFLKKTLESILSQTFKDFELLILNDASTDSSKEIIMSFDDDRIRYIENEENLKLIKTLNKGISLSNGEYIARIDADDICLPTRFSKQVEFLNQNSHVAVVGTDIYFIDENGKRTGRGIVQGTSPLELSWEIHRRCCLYHPSVMINFSLIGSELNYDEDYLNAEDYELWLRLSKKYKLANLSEPLLEYRIHGASITQSSNDSSVKFMLLALKKHSHLIEPDIEKRDEYSELLRFPFRIKDKSQYCSMLSVLITCLLEHLELSEDDREIKALKMNAVSYILVLTVAYAKKFKVMPIFRMNHFIKQIRIPYSGIFGILRNYSINIYRRILFPYFS